MDKEASKPGITQQFLVPVRVTDGDGLRAVLVYITPERLEWCDRARVAWTEARKHVADFRVLFCRWHVVPLAALTHEAEKQWGPTLDNEKHVSLDPKLLEPQGEIAQVQRRWGVRVGRRGLVWVGKLQDYDEEFDTTLLPWSALDPTWGDLSEG